MINAGIVGAAGYTGGELIRLLRYHSETEIDFIHSESQVGHHVSEVHKDLFDVDMRFTDQISTNVNVLFLCMGHGRSKHFVDTHAFAQNVKIIDLSHDFRLDGEHGFVYGLPELNRNLIRTADRIANPGCFATGIQLALLPIAKEHAMNHPVHVTAMTGSTGAGQQPTPTGHFSWRNGNISVYKAFSHQHLAEIRQSLSQLQSGLEPQIHFVPMRGNFTRGILASIYTETNWSEDDVFDLYKEYYKTHPFVKITDTNPDLKQVVNTNFCLIYPRVYNGMLHLVSVVDNLLKGASGQAVQNMNLMYNLPENQSLQLKSIAF